MALAKLYYNKIVFQSKADLLQTGYTATLFALPLVRCSMFAILGLLP